MKEYMSKNLGVPYVYLKDMNKYICSNGVVFTKQEYLDGIDLKAEYDKREANGELYDYAYAKRTGKLRKKGEEKERKEAKSVVALCIALMLTSFGSMYISTVHTATYLIDYVDTLSAWLMSTVITVYCATAFEVVVLFHDRQRHILSIIFAFLWLLVVTFSMVTTVSVFYDRYNFNTVQMNEEAKTDASARLALETLRKKETALSEAIEFKKKDIVYRQEHEFATNAVRLELESLQKDLQKNLSEQEALLKQSPDASCEEDKVIKKESLFAFLGRTVGLDGGVLEFIMSTLSAIFINLISPLSVSVTVSMLGGMKDEKR